MSGIRTNRLFLRRFHMADAQAYYEICKNPVIGDNAGWPPHKSVEDAREYLKSILFSEDKIFGIFLSPPPDEDGFYSSEGPLIGSIGLMPDPKRQNCETMMVGYFLDEAHWGNGYMSEALEAVLRFGFSALGVKLISAYCYPNNERSIRLLRGRLFEYEGKLSQAEQNHKGEILDHLCFALAKPSTFSETPVDVDIRKNSEWRDLSSTATFVPPVQTDLIKD